MANAKKKSGTHIQNDDRRCKKGWKQHPGVAPGAHPGKTVDGYTPQRLEARARIRALAASRNARQAV